MSFLSQSGIVQFYNSEVLPKHANLTYINRFRTVYLGQNVACFDKPRKHLAAVR